MRYLILTTTSFLVLSACAEGSAQDGAKLYAENCASCHGTGLESDSAPSLFDQAWAHGDDLSSIRKNIANGIEEVGMPGFAGGLSNAEIESLIVYIKSGEPVEVKKPDADVSITAAPALIAPIDEIESVQEQLNVEDYITGLDEPWGFHFIGEDLLITEKNGALKSARKSDELGEGWIVVEVDNIPVVNNKRQGGLLDVAPDPNFATNGWIYLTYSHPLEGDSGPSMTKLIRGKNVDNQWTNQETLFQAKPEDYVDTGFHYGSRITFDNEGHIYFSIGDRGPKQQAQDKDLPNGKIHRINLDGSIPEDNPFMDSKYPSIYSYGNRNPQGLIWHPETGVLWETEHGPKGGDELNAINSGINYGWPEISYGINYNGTILTEHQTLPGMAQPVSQWTPSLAVCGLDVYTGDLFPDWKGRLLAGSLAFESLRLIDVDGEQYVGEVEILKDKGRIRDVTTGPDGAIYVALPKKIVRLSPK